MLRPAMDGTFDEQLAWLDMSLQDTLDSYGLDRGCIVFRRFLCAELPDQVDRLRHHAFSNPDTVVNGSVSVVIQPPAKPALVSLWVYCIEDSDQQVSIRGNGSTISLQRGPIEHIWSTGMISPQHTGSHAQTKAIFDTYNKWLALQDMTLQEHCLRTWFYVRDVDNDYGDFVIARNDLFEQYGLTPDTHFIASTGIEGAATDERALVMMDAYAVKGVLAEQVRHLKALDHLPDTHVYGVAFERATEVSYRDRKHIIVSGTASIDAKGNVVHAGDVCKQLDRTLQNISALLGQAGAGLADMQHLIAYVRNPGDAGAIDALLADRVGDRPYVVVTGAVCRPDWLVEIEGIAITASDDESLPVF